jgi:pimeloyl-ACP methyl ester carboxylesterase
MGPSQWVTSDGVRLAVQVSGAGPPLIYAHGLTGSRLQSQRLLGTLTDRYRLITFDQRGHGASSPVSDPALFGVQSMADDISAIMDALEIESAIVGGTSMGAATALLFALRWPQRVKQLVLSAPAFGDGPHPASATLKQIGLDVAELGMDRYIARLETVDWPALGMTTEAMAARAAMLQAHDVASLALACDTVADWVILPDLTPLMHLDMPSLIIAWEDDVIHPLSLAQRIAAALPCSRLVLSSQQAYLSEIGMIARVCRPLLIDQNPS